MVGYPPNRGIIPIICEEMFKRVESNKDPDVVYQVCASLSLGRTVHRVAEPQVTASMLEIYNEQVSAV